MPNLKTPNNMKKAPLSSASPNMDGALPDGSAGGYRAWQDQEKGLNKNPPGVMEGSGGLLDDRGNRQSPRERVPGADGMPSPEGMMGGPLTSMPRPASPSPVSMAPPRTFSPLPGPSPSSLLGGGRLFGKQGGLLGGGQGVPGQMSDSTPNPSPLLAMLAKLLGQG